MELVRFLVIAIFLELTQKDVVENGEDDGGDDPETDGPHRPLLSRLGIANGHIAIADSPLRLAIWRQRGWGREEITNFVRTQCTLGRMTMKSPRRVLGHSLVRSLRTAC